MTALSRAAADACGTAVVDSALKFHGLGLRVVNASVMPTLIGGNTNAPAVEKAADMIRRRSC